MAVPRDEVRQQNECREVRNPEDVQPKRFGLKYDPPQVVLEYLERSTGKLYHRVITLHKLRPDTDPAALASKLKEKNATFLSDDKVSTQQLVDLIVKLQRHRKPTTPSQSVGTTSTERSPALGLFPSGRGTLPPRYAQPPSLHEEQLDDVTGAKPSEGFGLSTNSEPAPETSAPPPLPRGEDKASSSAAGLDNSGGDPPVDDLASRIAAAAAGVTFEARMNGLTEVEVLQQRRGGGGGRPGGSFPTATTSTEQVDPVRRGAGGFGGASSSSTADGGKFSFGSLPESKKEEVRLGSESEEDAGLPGKESSSRRPAGLPGKPNSSTGGRGPIGDNSGAGARHQPFTGPGEDVEEQEPIEDAVEDAYDEDFDEDDGLDALLSDLSSASDKAKARPADGAESRPTTNGFGTNGTNDPPKRSLLGDLPSLGGRGAAPSSGSSWQPPAPLPRFDPVGDSMKEKHIGLPDFDYENEDLNKLTRDEVEVHKQAMDESFKRSQKTAEDPDFEYDVRAEFDGAKEDCDWDDED